MTEFLVTVKEESKSKFIWNLLKEFDYLKVEKKKKVLSDEDKRILDGIEDSVQEIILHRQGKVQFQDAFEMIKEVEEELKAEGYYEN